MKKKIIVIDDETSFLKNTKSFFELFEYECLTATDGEKGLALIEKENPELVIADVFMPQMDGYSMLCELKKRKIKIKTIVLTAKEKLHDLFQFEEVDKFFVKPVQLEYLKEVVDELLSPSTV